MNTVARALVVAVVASACLASGVGNAAAHTALAGSDPVDGATEGAAPTVVTLTFTEDINPTFANVVDIVRSVLVAGSWELDEDMVQTFSRIFFGAMASAGESVAGADDPIVAADRVEIAISFIISGFQALTEAGVQIPTRLASPADD